MKRMFLKSVIAAVFAALVVGCGGSGGGNVVKGVVKNFKTGANLQGVKVKIGANGVTVTSGQDGSFSVSGVTAADRIVVTFKKDGFADTAKITKITSDITEADLQVNMVPAAASGTLNPAEPNTLSKTGENWQVVLGENALDATGQVTWEVTPIDPAEMGIGVMAGDMQDTDGNPIESFGAVAVTFKDAAGHAVNLKDGETATIHIPAVSRGTTLPATIPLYYFDEESGYWKKEGTATLKGTAPNQYYEGTVGHFSWWNCDQPIETVTTVTGCVEDVNGTKEAHARVVMEGKNYNGTTTVYTDGNGKFTIRVKRSAKSLLTAHKVERISNTVEIEPTSSTFEMSSCLVLDAFTAKLTWGANPRDLDTHVVGPDGPTDYHIWYQNKGSLAGTGARSNLDVDDTTSYGPEIYTALKLAKAGTYHYAVYRYAGSSNIAASPAHVEVMLNGDKTVFVPTGAHAERWWRVFDFTVDNAGKVTNITKVDTWTDDTGWPAGNNGH